MKLLLPSLLLFVFLAGCEQPLEVYSGTPLERDGLYYAKNTNTPLTAKVETYYDKGQLEIEYTVIEGKQEGLYRAWHENGQLQIEVNFVGGNLEGLVRAWYENGQLRREVNYVNGLREGRQTGYKEDGTKNPFDSCFKAGEMGLCEDGE